jgi:hypothetical protein
LARQTLLVSGEKASSFFMSVNEPQSSPPIASSPDELSQLLEIELIQKRAEWQRTIDRNKNLKAVSLVFLAVVVLGGLGVLYFVFLRASEEKQHRPAQTALTPTEP